MTPAPRHRLERLAALLRETLARALTAQVRDPRVGFVTITGVVMSPDATHATVRVSVMGTEEQKASAMAGLDSARGFLRTHVARALRLRSTPELHFRLDRGLEHAQRINQLLTELKRGETPS